MKKELKQLEKLVKLLIRLSDKIKLKDGTVEDILRKIEIRRAGIQDEHEEELIRKSKYNGSRL
jgi:hypothetical protein